MTSQSDGHFDGYGRGPNHDDAAIAGAVGDAMSRRHAQLRAGTGSLPDVHRRARRITRRRTAVGAGALAAVGAVGAIAVASRGNDGGGPRIVGGEGSSGGSDVQSAAPGGSSGYWRCTGPLSPFDPVVGMEGVLPTAVTVTPSAVSTIPVGFDLPSTSVPFVVDPTSTVGATTIVPGPNEDSTSTSVLPNTTLVPFDPTSTTVDSSAATSTTDPGQSTATSLPGVPSSLPVPAVDGVYYMSDCTYVAVLPGQGNVSEPDTAPPSTESGTAPSPTTGG